MTDRTQSPFASHNAVAALVEMYAGIVADYDRMLKLTNAQRERDHLVHAEQLKEGKAQNEKLVATVAALNTELHALKEKLRKFQGVPTPPSAGPDYPRDSDDPRG